MLRFLTPRCLLVHVLLSNGAHARQRGVDMTSIISHNEPPDRKWGWTCRWREIEWVDDVMPGRDGPENFRILKRWLDQSSKQAVEFFFDLIRWDKFRSRPAEMSWDLRHYKMNSPSAGCEGWLQSILSIDPYELSPSSRVIKGRRQKEIQLFVSETIVYLYYYYYHYWFHLEYPTKWAQVRLKMFATKYLVWFGFM